MWLPLNFLLKNDKKQWIKLKYLVIKSQCLLFNTLKIIEYKNLIERQLYILKVFNKIQQRFLNKNTNMLTKTRQHFYLFLLGLSDSLSPYWLKKILFAVKPLTKQTHPQSLVLLKTFKDAFVQVILLFICVPSLLDYFDFDRTAIFFQIIFLLLSYGYLFFYNIQVMKSTKQISLWSANFSNTYFCRFDVKQKFDNLYGTTNLIKNFIFLVLYYTPLNAVLILVSIFMPKTGAVMLLISQAFFSSTFYFLEKWPYDRFNIAFIENNFSYMLGYGFIVSLISNVLLDGFLGIASFLMISLWLMVNCQLHSPPPLEQISSFSNLLQCIKSQKKRAYLQNSFNVHRQKLRREKQYRKQLKKSPLIVKPALMLTQYLNKKLGQSLEKKFGLKSRNNEQEIKEREEEEEIKSEIK